MEALSEVVRAGKARYIGFSEWPRGADRGVARAAGRRALRLQPAAVLDALARARGRGDPAVRTRAASRRSSGRRSAQGVLTGKYRPGEPPPAGLARGERRA